ncbi:Thiol:disulfide interchange protein DsbD [Phycisphaerales bacterium]|nr:Thiol:disulfide interchange protein DsbD [Phycisphaerales bacterium]
MLQRTLTWAAVVVGILAVLFTGPRVQAQGEPPVTVSVESDRTGVRPGDQFVIAVIFDHAPGWHVHTNDPKIPPSWGGFLAIPTEIAVGETPGVVIGAVQWPKVATIPVDLAGTGVPTPYGVFEGSAVAFVPVTVKPDATGKITINLNVSYQACNDRTCMIPESESRLIEQPILGENERSVASVRPDLFKEFDRAAFAAAPGTPSPVASTLTFNEFGLNLKINTAGFGFGVLLLLALLGGFVLNLTPCVLPVIPIKMMGLASHAGNRAKTLWLGIVMSMGVIAFWLTIGTLMVSVSSFKAINQLFQLPVFTFGVGAFILVMAVGMLGLFSIRLPQFVYAVDPRADSVSGSLVFGVMTAVLSTPCTAPFMATAAAWATKQPTSITMIVFGAIGLGMALPYLVLAAFPRLVSRVPRSGPISDLVKQVIGVLMIAVAVFFIGTGLDPLMRQPIDPPVRWFWWVIFALVLMAMTWLIRGAVRHAAASMLRTLAILAAVVFVAGTFFVVLRVTDRGPIRWIGYTPDRFEEARKGNRVIVMDFTAEWCLNCKTLENTVLHRDEIVKLLNSPGVAPFRVDLSGKNEPGQKALSDLGWVGIPLLAISGPGLSEPIKYDWYTPEMVMGAIEQAEGKPVAISPGSPPAR